MSSAEEEARAARVLRYKEERRRQLRAQAQAAEDDERNEITKSSIERLPTFSVRSSKLKSASERNLRSNVVGGSAIRTTIASRLRSALSADVSQPRRSNGLPSHASIDETRLPLREFRLAKIRKGEAEEVTEEQKVEKIVSRSSDDVSKRIIGNDNRASRLARDKPASSSNNVSGLPKTQTEGSRKVVTEEKVTKRIISSKNDCKRQVNGKDNRAKRLGLDKPATSSENVSGLAKTQQEESIKATEEQKVTKRINRSSENISKRLLSENDNRASRLAQDKPAIYSENDSGLVKTQKEGSRKLTKEQNVRKRITGTSVNNSKPLVNVKDNRASRLARDKPATSTEKDYRLCKPQTEETTKVAEDQKVSKIIGSLENDSLTLLNEMDNKETKIGKNKPKTSSKASPRKNNMAILEERRKTRSLMNKSASIEKWNDDIIRTKNCSTPVMKSDEVSSTRVNSDLSFEALDHNSLDVHPPGFVPVHRFSDLLSNSVVTINPDSLFENILAENGIDREGIRYSIERAAAATGGCRRASRLESPVVVAAADSPAARGRMPMVSSPSNAAPTFTERRAMERRPLQNSAQANKSRRRPTGTTVVRSDVVSSSSSSPKSSSATSSPRAVLSGKESSPSSNSGNNSSSNSPSSMINSITKLNRKSSESGKASLIPLCKSSVEREKKGVAQCKKTVSPKERNEQLHALSKNKTDLIIKSNAGGKDTHNKINNALDGIDNLKKRLTNVDIVDHKNNKCRNLTKRKHNDGAANEIDINNRKMVNTNVSKPSKETLPLAQTAQRIDMKSHVNTNRLSYRMDNLAAFTKETLARVNKLNNNKLRLQAANDDGKHTFSSSLEETSDNCNTFPEMQPSFTNVELVQATNSAMKARGVSERLQDIDAAAQHLRDFEKNTSFCDLNINDSSQKKFNESSSSALAQIPVSILKRKSIQEEHAPSLSVCPTATPPVTFSPNVVDPRSSRTGKQTQGILKKRRSLDESQVSRNRSCSPEVSFASDSNEPSDCRPILKSLRRSSLEDVVRNQSPESNIQGILKRKLSREEEHLSEDRSLGSPEPQGILKRKSNSSSSSSTTSSHISIAQAVILAAAGGAEIIVDDKDCVRPILKKKSFSEERPSPEVIYNDIPRPILKKKSLTDPEEHDQDRPKKTILKMSKMSRKLSNEDGNTSSFDLSEDDRSSRRPSLLRSRMSDHSGSECEGSVKPILKPSGCSHSRQRFSFSAEDDNSELSIADDRLNSNSANESGILPGHVLNSTERDILQSSPKSHIPSKDVTANVFPSAVLRRRNLRPKNSSRSKSLACDFDAELFSILNQRRQKVENAIDGVGTLLRSDTKSSDSEQLVAPVPFVPIAMRIKNMENYFTKECSGVGVVVENVGGARKKHPRDRERIKTQPVTVEEMRSITSLDAGQTNFQPYGPIETASFPSRFAGETCAVRNRAADEAVCAALDGALRRVVEVASAPVNSASGIDLDSAEWSGACCDSLVSWCDPSASVSGEFAESSSGELLAEVEAAQEAVVRALRTLDVPASASAPDPQPAVLPDADAWSLDVSHDSGVFNKAESRDSGPPSAEELAATAVPKDIMMSSQDECVESEVETENCRFPTGLVRSNSVAARASMWQQLQQQAKGVPRPLLPHRRTKSRDYPDLEDRLRPQAVTADGTTSPAPPLSPLLPLAQSPSAANLQHDEDGYKRERLLSNPAERMITAEVKSILKSGSGVVTTPPPHPPTHKGKTLHKGESSEGLKDEGIDSSSEEESDSVSTSSSSSSDKSCSTDSSGAPTPTVPQLEGHAGPRLLKSSRTDSDLTKILRDNYVDRARNMLPFVNEQPRVGLKSSEQSFPKRSGFATHLASQNRSAPTDSEKENVSDDTKVRSGMESAKKRFLKKFEEELSKSKPPGAGVLRPRFGASRNVEREGGAGGSGSDGESSGGREVRHINTRRRNFRTGAVGGATGAAPLARSATHGALPTHAQRGGTIAERLAALQQNGNNEWRKRVEPLGADAAAAAAAAVRVDAANRKNDSLNQRAEDKRRDVENETQAQDIMAAAAADAGVVADRRDRLEAARNGWKRRVGGHDAALYSVAGRMEKEGVPAARELIQITPPASPGVPAPNNFRSRRAGQNAAISSVQPSPGPLRSASCAIMGGSSPAFRRSQSAGADAAEPLGGVSEAVERTAKAVVVPRADDETFAAFFERSVLTVIDSAIPAPIVADLDVIDGGNTHLLSSQAAGRARVAGRPRRHAASRNPLRALAARDDLCSEYTELEPAPAAGVRSADAKRAHIDKVCGKTGLAAEALAALASREDFAAVSLRSAATSVPHDPYQPYAPHQSLMLMQVKGRRRVQTRLVEPVHSSINCGDCFVLVTPDEVFHYVGQYANVIERSRGSDIALNIHNTKDLGCKNSAAVTTIDELTKNYSARSWNKFWSLLRVQDLNNFQPVGAGHSDEDEIYESGIIHTNMCYELLDDELVPIKEYWGQVPKISMLNLSKIIVFDFGSELYIWNGKNAPLEKRRLAAQLAKELFDEGYNYEECHICPIDVAQTVGARDKKKESSKVGDKRPEWAILAKVTQHMETVLFREKFLDWPDFTRVIKVKEETEEKNGRSNSTEMDPCNAEEMLVNEYQDPNLILEGTSLGRGTHYYDKESMRHFEIKTKSVCKWIVHEYDYQKIEDENEIGEFYSGDSYIIRWEYQVTVTGRELNGKPSKHNLTGRDRCAYFCWQGKDASPNEKGTAALLTVELDKEQGPQVRVTQGNEPPAFLNLFQGNLIVHQGKKDTDKSRFKLYITRGNIVNEAYLLQVPCSMRQLRSRGSMLLIDTLKRIVYTWHGVRSMKHTKNVTIALANRLTTRKSPEIFGTKAGTVAVTEVTEGEEPSVVLEALGGANRQLYFNLSKESEMSPAEVTPRMFHLSDVSCSGQMQATEVLSPLRHEHHVTPYPFEQKELYDASQPGLFLIDDGRTVWMWQGWRPRRRHDDNTHDETQDGAFTGGWRRLRLAGLRLVREFAGGRPALVVSAGLEPLPFANLFPVWQDRDDIAEINMAHGWKAAEARLAETEEARVSGGALLLPLAALRQRPLPDAVDPAHIERHLAPHDFQEAFEMTKEEFSELPAWKQTNMKKELGLF